MLALLGLTASTTWLWLAAVVVALASMATSALVVAAVLAAFSLARQHNLLVPSRRQSAVAAVVLPLVAVMAAMVAILPSLD
jgi:hypothetical protein